MVLTDLSDDELRDDIIEKLDRFRGEIEEVLHSIVLPNWGDELHGRTHLLYGSMMMCFAYVDLLSALWRGTASTKGQSRRMVDFLERYVDWDRESAAVAVRIWRHKLMHTARPRALKIEESGKRYYWLLQWGRPHLDREHHLRFNETRDMRILGIGLTFLIKDVREAAKSYFEELDGNSDLQSNFSDVRRAINDNTYRPL